MQKMKMIKVKGWECKRCRYSWQPKHKHKMPKVCAKCHSAWWDTERKM